jgi:hypothetical protein
LPATDTTQKRNTFPADICGADSLPFIAIYSKMIAEKCTGA